MDNTIIASILPYAVISGILASIAASIGLTTGVLLRSRDQASNVIPRLKRLEAAIRSDTSKIDLQLYQIRRDLQPDLARSVVADLSTLAEDLQNRAFEVHRILDEVRLDSSTAANIENVKHFDSLGLAVGETEKSIKAIVKRIEDKKQMLDTGVL